MNRRPYSFIRSAYSTSRVRKCHTGGAPSLRRGASGLRSTRQRLDVPGPTRRCRPCRRRARGTASIFVSIYLYIYIYIYIYIFIYIYIYIYIYYKACLRYPLGSFSTSPRTHESVPSPPQTSTRHCVYLSIYTYICI